MAIPSFYCPELAQVEESVLLSEDESRHAIKVRRLELGTIVRLFDGAGVVAKARLDQLDKKRALAQLIDKQTHSRSAPLIRVASAVPKGDRQRVLIDMLSQLGVDEFTPLMCDRSVVKVPAKASDKWSRYSIEACKQSQNPFLLQINAPETVGQVLNRPSSCIYLDQGGNDLDLQCVQSSDSLTLLIGPEGGFSDQELQLLKIEASQSVAISPHILRTEAAAVSAAAILCRYRSIA